MTRKEEMTRLAAHLTALVRNFGRRSDIQIRYDKPDRETIDNYTDFQQRYHGILTGNEYFMVYEEEEDRLCLLYVVNVTFDSALCAAYELMELAHRKF